MEQKNSFSKFPDDPYRIDGFELIKVSEFSSLASGVIYHFTLDGNAEPFKAMIVCVFVPFFLLFECLSY